MTLREWWGRVTSSKYTRQLEADLARLRGENRALLNSILGIAGVPPVVVAGEELTAAAGTVDGKATAAAGLDTNIPGRAVQRTRTLTAAGTNSGAGPVMRRRSWQQIYRMLEMDSARKKEAGETI